jgi:beta-glucuronidase
VLALGVLALAPSARPASGLFIPPERANTYDGPAGRFLLSGTWLSRRDRGDRGLGESWYRRKSSKGWGRVSVPNAWNAGNYSPASMSGGVTWYRKDFALPSAAATDAWLVRFESTRYRVKAWLNGKPIGQHSGGYLPFELQLRALSRAGANRLVVRVDNRQRDLDIPSASLTTDGLPNGGWWNYGGLLGDVYLRRVNRIDMPVVRVYPRLPCRTCDARIDYLVTVQNYGQTAPVTVTSRFGGSDVSLGTRTVRAGRRVTFKGSTTVADPLLWSPASPTLYPVTIDASGAGGEAHWRLETGIRSIAVSKGRLLLNGLPVNFRGAFFHEDSPAKGGAADPARMRLVIDRLKSVGGTLLRTHYPLDPYLHQLADRQGVLIWSEIPVYQMDSALIGRPDVRRTALHMMRENVLDKANHPSVLTWSMANELAAEPTTAERTYFNKQSQQIRSLDPTRPVSLVILGYPTAGCKRTAYKPVDLLGVNTYFGWYPGPNGTVADRRRLSPYLDWLRKCYTKQAIANTEFGAEANRNGPTEERGTYGFQADYNDFTLGVYAKKPWISGAIGMLMAFRCRPGWAGGNPHPSPPVHEKGVFDLHGRAKPAAKVMSDWYHSTQQYDLPAP